MAWSLAQASSRHHRQRLPWVEVFEQAERVFHVAAARYHRHNRALAGAPRSSDSLRQTRAMDAKSVSPRPTWSTTRPRNPTAATIDPDRSKPIGCVYVA